MPFVNIRLVKELIADDPGGKKDRIGKGVVKAITETTGNLRVNPSRARWMRPRGSLLPNSERSRESAETG